MPPKEHKKPLEASHGHLQGTPHHGSLLKLGIDFVTFLRDWKKMNSLQFD